MAGSDPVRVVITGGPGTGKTTLLEELARRGFAVEREVARAILREPGGMELRAQDPLGFALAMFDAEVSAFARAADRAGPTIYDRGLPDIVGFLRLERLPVPPDIERACRQMRYDGPVFRTPPWAAIFRQDAQRIQNWEQARASDEAVARAWADFGYAVIDLPNTTVAVRADAIIAAIDATSV